MQARAIARPRTNARITLADGVANFGRADVGKPRVPGGVNICGKWPSTPGGLIGPPEPPRQQDRRGHKHFLEMRLRQGLGKAADVVDLEAFVGLIDPLLPPPLQQCVQVHRSAVIVDVVRSLAVGEKLDSFDEAGGVPHDGMKVVGGIVVDKAETTLMLSESIKSESNVKGMWTTREVVGVMVRELGKYCASLQDIT